MPFLLRLDNGLVFTSHSYAKLLRGYSLEQKLTAPHCSVQNGMVKSVIRTLNTKCMHWYRFDTLQHASRTIGNWIAFYNIGVRIRCLE